ncbi:Bro-N domain-containing protein [Serratia sp. BNK-17]|uniref:BRO-N domain-containing protein n=1 Tax=Serratia sp. BNK-17 TaxID=3376154 RepID=UPI003B42E5E5
MTNQLAFHDTQFNVVNHANQIWLSSKEIANALGYSSSRAVTKIFNQNQDEFTAGMTDVVEVPKSGTSANLKARSRIFSLRGAHLIAMFARTEIAKEFRRWVLDILDKETAGAPAPLVVRTERCNYPAMNELLERPSSFVSEFNGMAYVDSKALARIYGVSARDLNAIVRRLEVTQDFAERNIVKCKGAGYQFTLWGFLLLSRHIEGDLSSEVTLAFIRALMANTGATAGSSLDTPLLVDSDYRRRARDYAADMFQRWYRHATAAGISVDDFNRADIDKFADGLLADALTRFRVEIGFNQHLEAKVSFLPQDVIQLAPSSKESMSNLVQNVVDTDVLQEMLMAGVARLGRAAK